MKYYHLSGIVLIIFTEIVKHFFADNPSWVEDYYANGQLWRKGNYKNGTEEGFWQFYDKKGQLILNEYNLVD